MRRSVRDWMRLGVLRGAHVADRWTPPFPSPPEPRAAPPQSSVAPMGVRGEGKLRDGVGGRGGQEQEGTDEVREVGAVVRRGGGEGRRAGEGGREGGAAVVFQRREIHGEMVEERRETAEAQEGYAGAGVLGREISSRRESKRRGFRSGGGRSAGAVAGGDGEVAQEASRGEEGGGDIHAGAVGGGGREEGATRSTGLGVPQRKLKPNEPSSSGGPSKLRGGDGGKGSSGHARGLGGGEDSEEDDGDSSDENGGREEGMEGMHELLSAPLGDTQLDVGNGGHSNEKVSAGPATGVDLAPHALMLSKARIGMDGFRERPSSPSA